MEVTKIRLNAEEIQVSTFVTMLDEPQEVLVANAWGSNWYNTCIGGTSPGTVGCDGTYSFDQTAYNC